MEIEKEFMDMVSSDIKKIEDLNGGEDLQFLLKLHRELDGKYQVCVKDWYKGLWGSDNDATNIWYGYIDDNRSYVLDNLYIFKAKLETFRHQMNINVSSNLPSTQVNVTTNINMSISFDQARSQVENMTSLTDKETDEILEKITELEQIVSSNEKKKSKWEKAKSILVWLADKSFDVGMTILPLLLKIEG